MPSRLKAVLAIIAGFIFLAQSMPLLAQDMSGMTKISGLWMDTRTKQIFAVPGPHRVPVTFGAAPNEAEIEQRVEQKTDEKVRAAVAQAQAEQRAHDDELAKKVSLMEPAWKSYVNNWQDKFHIGALFYADYRFYTHTGFQPQELENITNPGVGNNNYNAFDVTRTYLNVFFNPTKDLTFRFTPDLYKTIGSSNVTVGKNTGFGSNLDGNMALRVKYAYVQYTGLWNDVKPLKGGDITFGANPNPFIPWEEDLYGFRYVNLVPWNYVGLSSSQLGLQMSGPVRLYNSEVPYLEYGFGVYNNANFHAYEQSDTKQIMARLSAYPFGEVWRFQGLGITGFFNYGWGNTTPDNVDLVTPLKQTTANIMRLAALVHYSAPEWNIAGEFDYGKNAFSLGNLYSGSGPADAFGTATGTPVTTDVGLQKAQSGVSTACSAATPCYNAFSGYGDQVAVYRAMLQNGRERSIGFDAFGHYHIPNTKLTLFGMYQWFMPNDNIPENPLDFQRFVAGISYQYNEYLRVALDSQNLMFYHDQFGIPVSKAEAFNYVPTTLNGRKTANIPSFVIPDMVPRDTHSIFLNVEFDY